MFGRHVVATANTNIAYVLPCSGAAHRFPNRRCTAPAALALLLPAPYALPPLQTLPLYGYLYIVVYYESSFIRRWWTLPHSSARASGVTPRAARRSASSLRTTVWQKAFNNARAYLPGSVYQLKLSAALLPLLPCAAGAALPPPPPRAACAGMHAARARRVRAHFPRWRVTLSMAYMA